MWITAAIRKEEQLGIDDHALLLLHYSSRMPPLQRGQRNLAPNNALPCKVFTTRVCTRPASASCIFSMPTPHGSSFDPMLFPNHFSAKSCNACAALFQPLLHRERHRHGPAFFGRTSSLRFLGYYSSPLPCDDTIGREKIQEELKCFAFKTSWA